MKGRKVLLIAMTLILAMATCTTAYAQSIEVYTTNDVYYESTTPKSPTNVAKAIWMTYDKNAIQKVFVDNDNPTWSDFPQSIFYTEPNPSGYGADATGTLYLVSVSKIFPNDPNHRGYWCGYMGTMGYFLN